MANEAPIEVWQTILEHAIAVPLFFDTDPVTNYGLESLLRYSIENDYWESERTRNFLRRVCRSWNAFLKQYDHRYVRFSDVYSSIIPSKVMPMAVRLNIEPDYEAPDADQGMVSRMRGLLVYLLTPQDGVTTPVEEWRMEILTGRTFMDPAIYTRWLERVPRLRAVLHPAPSHRYAVQPTAAGLQFLYMNPCWARTTMQPFTLQHLTTLHLATFSINASVVNWNLPSLRHLSIESFPIPISNAEFSHNMMEIAETLGRNLTLLHYQGLYPNCAFPPNIWPHIPRVERIQMPSWKGTSIPTDHPARLVTIPITSLIIFMAQGAKKPSKALFDHIPQSAQFPGRTLTVHMDVAWSVSFIQRSFRKRTIFEIAAAKWLEGYYRDHGVEFADREGVTWTDHVKRAHSLKKPEKKHANVLMF